MEKPYFDPVAVKATEQGSLGLIRWFDQQGVDVRPSDNITKRIATNRGFDKLANYLAG
ncbi:MAG: hypothetical protein ACI8P9_004158 [Parasphingorhabdus sp.]|jgi:hypothetical protein